MIKHLFLGALAFCVTTSAYAGEIALNCVRPSIGEPFTYIIDETTKTVQIIGNTDAKYSAAFTPEEVKWTAKLPIFKTEHHVDATLNRIELRIHSIVYEGPNIVDAFEMTCTRRSP